jgi:hypothetical protein
LHEGKLCPLNIVYTLPGYHFKIGILAQKGTGRKKGNELGKFTSEAEQSIYLSICFSFYPDI